MMSDAQAAAAKAAPEAEIPLFDAFNVADQDNYTLLMFCVRAEDFNRVLAQGRDKAKVRVLGDDEKSLTEVLPGDYVRLVNDGKAGEFIVKAVPAEGQTDETPGVPMVLEALPEGIPADRSFLLGVDVGISNGDGRKWVYLVYDSVAAVKAMLAGDDNSLADGTGCTGQPDGGEYIRIVGQADEAENGDYAISYDGKELQITRMPEGIPTEYVDFQKLGTALGYMRLIEAH